MLEGLQGFGEIPRLPIGDAEIVVHVGAVREELDRPEVGLDRLAVLLRPGIDVPENEVDLWILGCLFSGLYGVFFGLLVVVE